jgi:glutathione peroxidase
MVATSSVKGEGANPFFRALIARARQEPTWNFNKYLVSADFSIAKHFSSRVTSLDSELEKEIAALLGQAE